MTEDAAGAPTADEADPSVDPAAAEAIVDDPGASPHQRESRRLAIAAWEGPLLAHVPRCPRCGERPPRDLTASAEGGEVDRCARCGVDPTSAEAGDLLRAPGGKAAELARGFLALPRGALWLLKSGAVLRSAKVPLLVGLALSIGTLLIAAQWVRPWLIAPGTLSSLEGFAWAPLRVAVAHLGTVVGWYPTALLFVIVGWLLVGFPGGILAKLTLTPFLEHLTKDAEEAVLELAAAELPEVRDRSIGVLVLGGLDAFLLLGLQAALYVLCLPIAFVPVAGGILWLILPPILLAGQDGMVGSLVRRGYGPRARFRLWRAHRWRFFGFGVAFFAMACVPLLNVLLLPAAVVGGSLLYLELPRK